MSPMKIAAVILTLSMAEMTSGTEMDGLYTSEASFSALRISIANDMSDEMKEM